MSEVTRLLDQLRRAFDGDAWCGPPLLHTLADLSAAQAAARPWPGTHSVHEIVRHLTTWALTVAERTEQRACIPVAGDDWPAVAAAPAADEAGWAQAQAALRAAHERLLGAVAPLRDDELGPILGPTRDRLDSGGVSLYVLLHGTAQHYLYHAGQVALLRKYV